MTGLRQTLEGNRSRYFVSSREVVLVRFDPGTPSRDRNVRIESIAMPIRNREMDPRASAFGLLPTDLFRRLAAERNANIADAIAKTKLAPDGLSRFIDIAPLSTTRAINSHRSADELSVRLAWKDLPFDARIVRAMLLLHFEGTVPASAFGTGKPGEGSTPTGYLVPATYSNLRFVGMADEIGDEHFDGGDFVSIKARDLTAVLIDTKLPTLIPSDVPIPRYDRIVGGTVKTIRPGTNMLEVLRALLDTLHGTAADFIRGPFLRGITLAELPKLDRRRYPKIMTTALGRNQAARNGGEPVVIRHTSRMGEESYWDAITDLCVSHGLVPFVDRDMLILQPPRTLYNGVPEVPGRPGEPTFPTSYREKIGDTKHTVRRMVWGGNLASLRFQRKLARIKAPVVRVTSYNPDAKPASKRLLSVMHPKIAVHNVVGNIVTENGATAAINPAEFDPKGPTLINPTGQGGTIEIHNVAVQGITDIALLRKIAEATYETLGRAELGIVCTTSDVASWSDHPAFDPNQDPDLLDLRAGDPLELVVTPTERRTGQLFGLSELNLLVKRSIATASVFGEPAALTSAVAFLVARGWREEDARQLAKVLASANLMTVFRVQGASITIDGEQGDVQVQIDARDYIRARADPEDPSQTGGVGRTSPGQVAR